MAVTITTGAFIPIAVGLLRIRREAIRIFAVLLVTLAVLDLGVLWCGIAEGLWWLIHFPSAMALGVDEILERHGLLVSTVAHTGDLVLWALVFTVPIGVRGHLRNKGGRNSQQDVRLASSEAAASTPPDEPST